MKSSTIRRSALSRESMNVIENLSNDEFVDYTQQEVDDNSAPNEYLRPEAENKNETIGSKTQEIDLLWQTFKGAQFNTNSPWLHVVGGFLLGLFVSFLIVSAFLVYSASKAGNIVNSKQILINFSSAKTTDASLSYGDDQAETVSSVILENEDVQSAEEDNQVAEVSESAQSTSSFDYSQTKKYTVQDGDTVEAIIRRYYGAYSQERADAVMKANRLNNLDHISIGQVLLIPAEK